MDFLDGLPTNEILSVIVQIFRFAAPLFAMIITWLIFSSLMTRRKPKEPLAVLVNTVNRDIFNIINAETSIGRSRSCDIILSLPDVSRNHAVILQREDGWYICDLGSKIGVIVNGQKIVRRLPLQNGDVISIGGLTFKFGDEVINTPDPKSLEGNKKRSKYFIKLNPVRRWQMPTVSPSLLLILISIFQLVCLLRIFLVSNKPPELPVLVGNLGFIFIEWLYLILVKSLLRRKYIELEIAAFFLTGIGISVISTITPSVLYVQLGATAVGITGFVILTYLLRNPDRVMRLRTFIGIAAILLLLANIAVGTTINGAKNWIMLGPVNLQPSELVKVAFVFIGASSLEKLLVSRHLTWFLAFFGFCIAVLVYIGDFGSALIFFVTFIVIAIMRSGDWRTLFLLCTGTAAGVFGVLFFNVKPHVTRRFATWGHAWDDPFKTGYQQVQVMIGIASGGLIGLGPGQGHLRTVFAATTDIIFGTICEEWGLIVGICAVLILVGFVVNALRNSANASSTFYVIAACSSAGLLLFQACLNIFGATDVLPFTGVTLPFISQGGSSILASWWLLAFIKSVDRNTYRTKQISYK